jgi:formate-dependent nitrite reductase membrane component NrfD
LCKKLYARRFWIGGVCLGLVFPTIFSTVSLAAASPLLLAIGAAFALAGLWFYEDAWVRAGQSVPLS